MSRSESVATSFNNAAVAGLVWDAGDHREIMVLIHHRPSPPHVMPRRPLIAQ